MPLYTFVHVLYTVIFFILHNHLSYSFSVPLNCSDYRARQNFDLPTVRIYDAALDVPNYENNGTVILIQPLNDPNTLGWLGLECSHSKPIRWVYNLNYGEAGLGDSYSVTARDIEDFYNISTYSFRAEIEVKIHNKRLNFVLACITFDNPCERRVVQTLYETKGKYYTLKSLSALEEDQQLVKELESAVIKNTNWGQTVENATSCGINFSLVDNGESYFYSFLPRLGTPYHPRTVPDRQNLENSYLFYDHLSQLCISNECRHTGRNSTCFKAEKLSTHKYWPLVFFMKDGLHVSRVVHTYHTLVSRNKGGNEPGRLKFAWEYSNLQDFLAMEELPGSVYLGESITVNCHISPFLFSFGTQIGYLSNTSKTDSIEFVEGRDITEHTDIPAARVASAQIAFPLSYSNTSSKITVFCFSPIWNSSTEWVNISREFQLIEPKIEVHGSGIKLFEVSLSRPFSTSCTASGSPVPSLSIIFPHNTTRVELTENITNDFVQTNITIDRIDEGHAGFYNCVATNFMGTMFYDFQIKIKALDISEKTTSTLTIALISVFASISAIFLLVVIILLMRFHMEKEEFRRLTEEAVREFFDGLDEGGFATRVCLLYLLPTGIVEIGNRKSVIAIKTTKTAEDIDAFRSTLMELKIMSTIGNHRHIVKLIAASTDEINNRKILIGVEYCANGSLLSYLQKRKRLFTNLVSEEGRIQFQTYYNSVNDSPQEEEGMYKNLVVTSDISTIDLFKWSFQIASGMDYLESKKVLHCDLACRNVLLNDDLLVKISDFGLSRELFENSEYMKKTQVVLPFKWMAIESLKWLKFTIKSDVWSYGVVLYEIFTLGEEPYPGITWNEEFITALENGMRLDRPPFCTDNVYNQVMTQCWQPEPNDRTIRFCDAMSFFEKAIEVMTSHRDHDDLARC